ncbi:MAG: NDP-hexose 4-ketoreductase, partial [Chloroflexi bacterium]|nr:NDP-hexose 4-ketoreductase [Chloroflexota bacterium]
DKRIFRLLFILNRLDAVVVFHALTIEHVAEIVDIMAQRVRVQLAERSMTLEISPQARTLLAEKGYDPTFGARPLRRVIQSTIEDPLAEGVLEGRFPPGSRVVVDVEDGQIVLRSGELVPAPA